MSVFYWSCKPEVYLHVYYRCFITLCNWCCRSFFKIQVINSVLTFFFHSLSLTTSQTVSTLCCLFRTGKVPSEVQS